MLFKKMLRDIGKHKTQFISIFIMAFLALFIYAGIGGEWRGLRKSADTFYNNTNLADVFVYGSNFDDDALSAVKNISDVNAVSRRTEIPSIAGFDNDPEIALYFYESDEISKPFLVEGKEFDPNDADGVWLCKRFTDAKDLKVGDFIELSFLGQKIKKEIKGVIYSSEAVYLAQAEGLVPDFGSKGYAYLSQKAFPIPEMFAYSTLLIKTEKPSEVESQISKALDGKYAVYLEQENHPSVALFNNEINQHKMMADIFPVVFLLIALLTMMTTMTRMVAAQRIQIGTLKALGFKKKSIMLHYVSYGFVLTLVGSVSGLVVGPLTLPKLFYPSMSGFYTMPEWIPAYDSSFFVMTFITLALCTLVTYLAVRKELAGNVSETLRPKAPKHIKHGIIEKLAFWKKLSFNLQWNFRDAARNKLRSLMAIIGVFGCTALLVCAFGMNDSIKDLKNWQYEKIDQFESKLTVDEAATPEQLQTVKDSVNGEEIMESAIEVRSGNKKTSVNVRVTDNTTLISATDVNLKNISLPEDGVSITMRTAGVLGVQVGDEIEWHLYGSENWVASKIAAIYREPTMQGLSMEKGHFETYDYIFKSTAILSAQTVTEKYDGIATVLSTDDILDGWDSMTEGMNIMIFLLIAAAAILSIVVLYNLGLLAFAEMERDMATLKVMGMKTGKLRGLLLTQNLWFSLVGFAAGIPGGLWLIYVMVESSGDSFDFPIQLHFFTAAMSFAITFGLSIFVNLLFSRKIKKLNMVESLKAME